MNARMIAVVGLLSAAMALATTPLLAQPGFAPLRADGNDIVALRQTLPVGVSNQRLGDALRVVARRAGADFSTTGELAALDRLVSLDSAAWRVSVALLRLVDGSGVELLVSRNGPTVVARAARPVEVARTLVRGIVQDSATGEGIGGVSVEYRRSAASAPIRVTSEADGRFAFTMPAGGGSDGDGTLRVRKLGYLAQDMPLGRPSDSIVVALTRVVLPLSLVVVTPGFYGMMEQRVGVSQTLTREQIRAMPQVGEDLFRSVTRLPGVTASDFSAAFRVRGGANRELYATLDGLELVEPFHLKDFDGAISIIDVGAIAGVDLTTGGFGARFGNRLTGVMALRTVDPPPASETRTELALTLTTLRATSRGSFAGERGGWLVSARRGFLEYAMRAAGETDNLRPRYYDVLAKSTYRLGERASLSLHLLHAGDALGYQDDVDKPRIESRYDNSYAWAVARGELGGLSHETVLSLGRLSWTRDGTRTSMFDGAQDLTVRDDRTFDVGTVRQDWQWEPRSSLLLSWGGELRALRASYSYGRTERRLTVSQGVLTPVSRDIGVETAPDGRTYGGYVAVKSRLLPRLTAEAGLRADWQSYTGESQVSPRIAAAFEAGQATTLRAAWGEYAQPQGLHELQASDGLTRFAPAELGVQRVLGVEHRFGSGITARAEAYDRRLRRVTPRYTSVDNSIDVFPEIEPDRALLAPASARAHGVELLVGRSAGRHLTWSGSYVFAVARDVIDRRVVPRALDQRHTVALDVGWSPAPGWGFNAAWLHHSGWPTTSFGFTVDTLTDGSVFANRVYGARNADRFAPYHRLDLRATRTVAVRDTRLALFVDLFNVYNRRNARAYDPMVTNDRGRLTFGKRVDALLPRLPSFGVSWEF